MVPASAAASRKMNIPASPCTVWCVGVDINRRQVRSQLVNLLLHVLNQLLWRYRRSKLKRRKCRRILREGNIKIGRGIRRQKKVLPIMSHPNHFDERTAGAFQAEAFADGILVRPKAICHGLVHNRDRQRFLIIGISEIAATQQGDTHGAQVSRINAVGGNLGGLLVRNNGLAFKIERIRMSGKRHRHTRMRRWRIRRRASHPRAPPVPDTGQCCAPRCNQFDAGQA